VNREDQERDEESRPATLVDMARFWPDKTPDELEAARNAIAAAGGVMTVSTACDCECHGCCVPMDASCLDCETEHHAPPGAESAQ